MTINKTRVVTISISDVIMEQEEFKAVIDAGDGNITAFVTGAISQFFVRKDVLDRLENDENLSLSITVK